LHHAAATYGVSYTQMRAVSYCESRWNPKAVGNGSLGLFQFEPNTWAHTPYRHRSIFNAAANALAAAWLVRHDRGWREWTCRP
jgi:soluble lytic murein transglycosylase-like protein